MNERPKTPGQVCYEAYNNHGPNAGKTYDGKPIPPWEDLAEHTRERWEVAAAAVTVMFNGPSIGIGSPPPPPPPGAKCEEQGIGISYPPPPPPPPPG